jgi:glycosyltransferase involved in cell wall biosynthesis
MMRIALFTETFLPKVDGIVNTLCHLLDHLALRGHTSLLFAPGGGPERYARTSVVGLPTVPSLFYPDLRLIRPFVNVQPHLAEFKPDLIHLVNPVFQGPAALRAARRVGVPVVASYHTDIPGFLRCWRLGAISGVVRAWLRWLHNQADLNLTPSRVTRDELVANGFTHVKVWERGVDTTHFHPSRRTEAWRRRLSGGDVDAPLLLYVGRLSFEKRIDWLRPALTALPQVRLAVVGDGPARSSLERTFAGTPTIFTGYLRGEDLYNAYAAADVFAFPGANETVGNVILEAMASGLPVVAPRSGGLLDHVAHGENGLLFEPESRGDLVTVLSCLVDDPALARQLGEAGRRHAEARSWASTLDAVLEDYERVAFPALKRTRLAGSLLEAT